MKEVGDKFGAGELILPFVLQSAEVMKRRSRAGAIPRQDRGLHQGHGRARDGLRRRARHRQVARQHDPHQQRLHGRGPRQAGPDPDDPRRRASTRRQRSACRAAGLDLQADAGVHPGAAREGPRVPGADRRRGDQPCVQLPRPLPRRQRLRGGLRAWRLLLQGRLRGPRRDGPADRRDARGGARRRSSRAGARRSAKRARSPSRRSTSPTTRCAPRAHRRPVPAPPFWGVREIDVDLEEVYRHLDTHVLFKLHWGGRGVKGEAWKKLLREDFQPRLERMWREQDYLHPRALLGFFPCYSLGNDIIVLDPEDRTTRAHALRLPAPAQGRAHLPRRLLPARRRRQAARGARRDRRAGRHRRLGGDRTDGEARVGRRVRRAAVRPRPRRADRGGPRRMAAPRDAQMLGIPASQGRRYSWGYPAVPEQSEHLRSRSCSGSSRSG